MEINITQDRENKLLGRREVAFTAEYESKTPTKEEVREGICKKLNLNPDSTEIVRIDQLYGQKASSILVYSYSSREQMQKLAPKVKEKKAGAAPAAAKPAEKAPAKEEKKEEKKEQKKEAPKEEKKEAPKPVPEKKEEAKK